MNSTLALLLVGLCLGTAALGFFLWVLMTKATPEAADGAGEAVPRIVSKTGPAGREGNGDSSTPSTAGTDG